MASSDKQWWRSAKVLQWGGGVLVLAVCGALLLSASVVADTAIEAKADAAAQQAVPPLKVAVLGAERRDGYAVRRSFVGRVEAARSADVAFELSGRVMTLDADDGDTVTEGQVLATLDTARLQAQLTEAQARVSQADADRRLAAIRLERIEASAAVGSASTEELDEAEQRAASTEAAVLVARSAVDRVQVEIDLSTLVAPFDAVVARRSVDPGVVVQPGQAVFQLLDRRKPEARIGLAGPAAEQLAEGDQVTVSVRGRGGVVDVAADVARILPTRDARARTVEVVLVLDTELDGIRRGDLATLVLERRIEANHVALPLDALTEGVRGLWAIYVAVPTDDESTDATHRLERRDMQLLGQTDDTVYVDGPLATGELVVANGIHKLVPDLAVRITRQEATR